MYAAPILGLACAGGLALAWRSRSGSAQVMALAMLMLWAGANHLVAAGAYDAVALMDLAPAAIAWGLWHERRKPWQAAVVAAFACRFLMHIMVSMEAVGWVPYAHTINALYLAVLIAIGWEGGIRDAVDRCLRGLRQSRHVMAVPARGMAKASPR